MQRCARCKIFACKGPLYFFLHAGSFPIPLQRTSPSRTLPTALDLRGLFFLPESILRRALLLFVGESWLESGSSGRKCNGWEASPLPARGWKPLCSGSPLCIEQVGEAAAAAAAAAEETPAWPRSLSPMAPATAAAATPRPPLVLCLALLPAAKQAKGRVPRGAPRVGSPAAAGTLPPPPPS